MAQAVLLGRSGLGKSALQFRHKKYWIIAEAACATRRVGYKPLDKVGDDRNRPTLSSQCGDANKSRLSILSGLIFHFGEQLRYAISVRGVCSRVPCRTHAGCAP